MPTPGKLEVTIKINQLPVEVTTKSNGWKEFTLECGERLVTVALRPRMWNKLEEAQKSFAAWVAALSGTMGPAQGKGFTLLEPNLQVFERKIKTAEGAPPEGSAPPGGAPPA
jgi:hypothetical protein